MPAMVWPAPKSGEPTSGRKSVGEVNVGSALIELTSLPVSAFQAANVGRSKNGTCATVEVPMAPTAEKWDDGPAVYRSL